MFAVIISQIMRLSPHRLTLLKDELDVNLYPTEFECKWQIFEHVDKVYLRISGAFNNKPKIGKYAVKIVSLNKLRE